MAQQPAADVAERTHFDALHFTIYLIGTTHNPPQVIKDTNRTDRFLWHLKQKPREPS